MNTLKSSLVFWSRNKTYSFICLFGLIVSLIFIIIISNYTKNELFADSYHAKAERIYVLGNELVYGCAYKLADHLIDRYPEIEKICVCAANQSAPTEVGGNKFNVNITFVDTTFFNLFDFELISGDKKTALVAMNSAMISEKFANTAFANQDPIGKTLNLNGLDVQITGVLENIESSLFPNHEVLIRMEQIVHWNPSMAAPDMGNAGSAVMFILAKEGTDLTAKIPEMYEFFKEIYWIYRGEHVQKLLLTPLREVYFSDISVNNFNQGNKTFVLILISISIAILIFAIINYINLTVAQTGFRAKEMASRRLLGASRFSIFAKLITESVLITFMAYAVALFLAIELEKPAGNLLSTELSITGNLTYGFLALNLLIVTVIGIISGLVPAFIISNFKPIEVVKGAFTYKSKMVFSKVFIIIQNVITIVLITCTLIMYLQVRYMLKADLGYKTENIVNIDNQIFNISGARTFKNELLNLPCVEDVAFCQGYPAQGGNNNTMSFNGKSLSFQVFAGDSAYFKMLGFEVIQDNQVADWGFWFNETAMREMELPYDTLNVNFWNFNDNISGIIKDFHYGYGGFKKKIGPAALYYNNFNHEKSHPWSFLVKVKGDPVAAMNDIKAVYEQVSNGDVFTGQYIEDILKEMCGGERRTSTILMVFTIIAIVISSLGLYAMAIYFIRQRKGEIAVRKVFGSSNNQIKLKLLKNYLQLVIIAFVVAIPIIWYFMSKWLSDYSISISLQVWQFFAGGLLALLIAFLIVFYESAKAANANPIESIKK